MDWLRHFRFRLLGLFRKRTLESDMAEEIRAHLEMEAAANRASGMGETEARDAAQRQFGGVDQVKERCRTVRAWGWIEQARQDLRYAFSSLRKTPGFAAVAILTLGLCIGANSAIFSVVHAVLLKPYPWPESNRLVYIHTTYPLIGLSRAGCSIPDYIDRRAAMHSLDESALYAETAFNLTGGGTPELLGGMRVTPSLFSLLETAPALGRTFAASDAQAGSPRTVILSYALWKNRFNADAAMVGRTIRLNDELCTVVGVMPAGFYFPIPRIQLWVPFGFTAAQKSESARHNEGAVMIGRLRPGATRGQAQREADAVTRMVRARAPQLNHWADSNGYGGLVLGFLDENVGNVRATLWLVQASVLAALLIGCANVAGLLLARASAREREFAIRAALGAGRLRIMRQLLTESLVLFLLGGALGLVVAWWAVSALGHLGVDSLPRGFDVSLDAGVFAFTFSCAALAGLSFGAIPAWSAGKSRASAALKEAGARATAGRRNLWLRHSLVVLEIALALMLVTTSGLLLRSFHRLQDEKPGFKQENLLTALLFLPASKYKSSRQQVSFQDRLLGRLSTLPGVTSAGLTTVLPFSGDNNFASYQIVGMKTAPGQPESHGMIRQVSPDYFHALGLPLLRGRMFTAADLPDHKHVVIIDRILANRYWPEGDPIGCQLNCSFSGTDDAWTIVGVVGTVKVNSLEESVAKETLYFPYAQMPTPFLGLVIKTVAAPEALVGPMRSAVMAVDPEQAIFDVRTMAARLDEAMLGRRSPLILVGLFSGISLLLAALGVYGVLAFAVGQRTNEIGIRMALGAQRADILGLILRQGGALVALGLALGLAGYFALSRVVGRLLFGVAATDGLTLVLAAAVLAIVALSACFIPASRASRLDPMAALRFE